jgi:hypothetical protein
MTSLVQQKQAVEVAPLGLAASLKPLPIDTDQLGSKGLQESELRRKEGVHLSHRPSRERSLEVLKGHSLGGSSLAGMSAGQEVCLENLTQKPAMDKRGQESLQGNQCAKKPYLNPESLGLTNQDAVIGTGSEGMDLDGTVQKQDLEGLRKREPLRSKRYVPPRPLEVPNVQEPKPAATLRTPGPSQKTLERTAVLALPAATPPGFIAKAQHQFPSPRSAARPKGLYTSAQPGTVPVSPHKKLPRPQASYDRVRTSNFQATPRAASRFQPKPAVVAPVVEEKKVDAKTLSVNVWMLEQLLKNDNTDTAAIESEFLRPMALLSFLILHLNTLRAIKGRYLTPCFYSQQFPEKFVSSLLNNAFVRKLC